MISPHLDDAVLSLGGTIARWTAAGERVIVATVYTAGPALAAMAPRLRRFGDYAARRAEDAAACARLGAEVRWLDQLERVFRSPPLPGRRVFTTPATKDELGGLAGVTRALAALEPLAPTRIVAPLGVGNHVDHVEALVATTDWANARGLLARLCFYEDVYALAGVARRRHPVTRDHTWGWRLAPLRRAPRLAMILRAASALARGPGALAFVAPALRSATWTVARTDVVATEAQHLEAIACYPSQTRAFGGFAGIATAIRALHAWWGGAEPLWSATS